MDGDFFQLLRRIQKEERNKSTLARVENDFYKKLYSYIRSLERSVADNPFDVGQSILLNNAQRVATEICELRESKISKAANNNIYRSFHLFKKENPQFDLLDTTPLNLTDEEETLYFSLMDALKTHRYNISLDKFGDENSKSGIPSGYPGDGDDEDDSYSDNGILESRVNPGVVSEEEFFGEDNNSNAARYSQSQDVQSNVSNESFEAVSSSESEGFSSSAESNASVGSGDNFAPADSTQVSGFASAEESHSSVNESDEVLNRLNQIKNATVISDEKYEPIERQINNQAKVVPNVPMENNLGISNDVSEEDNASESDSKLIKSGSKPVESGSKLVGSGSKLVGSGSKPVESGSKLVGSGSKLVGSGSKPPKPSPKPVRENSNKSSSTLDFDSIFANPDSQFADIDSMQPDYDADFANLEAHFAFAQPNDADLIFSTKPKVKKESSNAPSVNNAQVDSQEKEQTSKSIKSIAKKEEIKNTTVVIFKDMGSIVGVDEKIYGPFLANDVVILPNITAQILVDNNKAGLIDI